MQIKSKNRFVNLFTLVVHFFISVSLFMVGVSGYSWDSHFNRSMTTGSLVAYFLIISVAIILFFMNFLVLSKGGFKRYLVLILTASFSMFAWVVIEGSMDVSAFLLVYLIVFIPLTFYKHNLYKGDKLKIKEG